VPGRRCWSPAAALDPVDREKGVNIHEYQAKDVLRRYGVPIPPGEVATTPEQAEAIARKYGRPVMV
jgi:acyl-CoA synthetase (NDP forming)